MSVLQHLYGKFFREHENRVYFSERICYNRCGKAGCILLYGNILQSKTPAQCAWVLKSDVIQTKNAKNRLTGGKHESGGQIRSKVSNCSQGTG